MEVPPVSRPGSTSCGQTCTALVTGSPAEGGDDVISGIELENLRVFCDRRYTFRTPALTVLCGTNGCGKSTVLKALLLLRQSLGIDEPSFEGEGRLRLVGSQVDLGDFASVVSHGEVERRITIGVHIDGKMPGFVADDLVREGSASVAPSGPDVDTPYALRACLTFGGEEVRAQTGMFAVGPRSVARRRRETYRGVLAESTYALMASGRVGLAWSIGREPAARGRPEYRLWIPRDYYERAPSLRGVQLQPAPDGNSVGARASLSGLLPEYMLVRLVDPTLDGGGRADDPEAGQFAHPVPMPVTWAGMGFREALANVAYLGPLRAPAERYYLTRLEARPAMDAKGESLPYVLRDSPKSLVWHVPPADVAGSPRVDELTTALHVWLRYLRTGKAATEESREERECSVRTLAHVLVEVFLRSPAAAGAYPLADSGFGYSQLLPVLVWGLLASRGTTLLIEQPELHLNPALQVRLAEFLVAMARTGKQIVVETHSEHVVNAVRVMIAEDTTGALSRLAKVYYIDSDVHPPRVRDLDILPDGTVDGWPKGFFGEAASLTGRLLRAQRRFVGR